MRAVFNLIKRSKLRAAVVVGLLAVLVVQTAPLAQQQIVTGNRLQFRTVSASGTADYTVGASAANTQAQAALSALPTSGGQIDFLSGTFQATPAAATVTRAIPGVTINGVGVATYFANNAAISFWTAGGNNWTLSNLKVDVTTAVLLTAMGATTGWQWVNVTTSDGYFSLRTQSGVVQTQTVNAPTGRTATYVVAAGDAPTIWKAQADYTMATTGTDITPIVNAAITAGNKTIELTEGTFTCIPRINFVSGVTVKGQGVSTLINMGNGSGGTAYSAFYGNGASDIRLSGMKFDLGGYQYSTAFNFLNGIGITIDNLIIVNGLTSSAYSGSSVLSSTNITVRDSTFDSVKAAIGISACTNIELSGLTISNTTDGAIIAGGNTGLTIKDNKIFSCTKGIDIGNSTKVVIDSNELTTLTDVSLYCESSALSTDIVITNNIFTGTTNSYNTIEFNHTGAGTYARVTISNNQIKYAQYGIAGYFPITQFSISNNNLENCSRGIVMVAATDGVISANTLKDCGQAGNAPAIHVGGCSYIDIVSNVIDGTTGSAKAIADESGSPASHMRAVNNIILNIAASPNKIYWFGTVDCQILNTLGYVSKGEIRTIWGTLAGVTPAGIMLAVDNPFGQAVRVLSVDVEVTTQGAASGSMCVGIGSDATTDYATMFSVLPSDPGTTYPYFYNSTKTATYGVQTDAINWATGSGNRYLNFYAHVANAAFVAIYTVTVMGN